MFGILVCVGLVRLLFLLDGLRGIGARDRIGRDANRSTSALFSSQPQKKIGKNACLRGV